MYKLLLLDFDGTLFHTKAAISFCLEETLKQFNYNNISLEAIKNTINKGITLEDSFKQLIATPLLTGEVESLVKFYRIIYNGKEGISKTEPFPHMQATLKKLFENNHAMVVLSNKGDTAINNSLIHFKIADYIKLVVGGNSSNGLKPKPDPMIYHEVISKKFAAIPLAEILVVGDTTADILFARNIGAKSCWVSYGYGNQQDCQAATPDYVIDNFLQLGDLVS